MSQGDDRSAVRRMVLQCKLAGRTASDMNMRFTEHQVNALLVSLIILFYKIILEWLIVAQHLM